MPGRAARRGWRGARVEHEALDEDEIRRIDAAVDAWRQGDCVVGQTDFVALEPSDHDEGGDVASPAEFRATTVEGLVVVTQSCDIARSCADRPMVEVSPLVAVEAADLENILSGRQVRLAVISSLTALRLVADLDRTMTVHKAVVADWSRTQGTRTDEEARKFSQALARKRARFAFPDDFNRWVKPLSKRISKKHDSPESPEGAALRSLAEIRVLVSPSWDASEVECTFYFVRRQEAPMMFSNKRWDEWLDTWLALLKPSGRFAEPLGFVPDHSTMSAAEYLASDQLDLDHLSAPKSSEG